MSSPTATKRAAALASVLALAAACSGETPATPVDAGAPTDVTVPSLREVTPVLANQFDLRLNMRQLWTEHVVWMRDYIIDAVAALPETPIALQHTLGTQSHIGDAFKPFYGKAAADQLTALWNTHVADAVGVVGAVKDGNPDIIQRGKLAWYANADQIAALMAQLNPNLSLSDLRAYLRNHVDLTFNEITARVAGNWRSDVLSFDFVEAHILTFSDFLTTGLTTQFRPEIVASTHSARDEELHVTMRKLWEEDAFWTRFYLIGRTARLADVAFAEERLLKNQTDIGNAFKPYYGAAAGDQLTTLLRDLVAKQNALFAALESSDAAAIAGAKSAAYASCDAVAQFLASKNPYWTSADLQAAFRHELDLTGQQVSARLAQNWQWDIIFYEAIIIDLLPFADLLANGTAQQFPQVPL